ncbi:hypothetical protein [Cognatiluteimonas profundi]|uniref:hypothetical protein n=1 Tax=Cognatiluteimonas profundi TaxID=2594501 RepID=UPI00131DFEE1|nr:hypothetical protein [Lysobacter profundi]
MRMTTALACCVFLLLAGCGRHDTTVNAGAGDESDVTLPKPAAAGGSVTGMPSKPGPGQVGPPAAQSLPAGDASSAAPADALVAGMPADPIDAAGAQSPDAIVMPAEPTAAEAIAVVREYYRSIDSLDFAHAWSLWSDGGRSSGQTLQQFADGFANTAHVTIDTGAPGNIEAAAGSRFIQVPVTIQATTRDGGTQRYSGTYTLRRAVVDGATAEQRAWRIASAALHPVQP